MEGYTMERYEYVSIRRRGQSMTKEDTSEGEHKKCIA